MTFEAIKDILEKEITGKRFAHIMGVVEAAEELAIANNISPEKARLAALLHDCCKEYPMEVLRSYLTALGYQEGDSIYKYPALWHGPVGAQVARKRFAVKDEDVLEAVAVHTTGKVAMSTLDKVIFLADYIEKNRHFPGLEKIRKKAKKDLDKGCLAGFDYTIKYLLKEKAYIYEGTVEARNALLQEYRNKGLGGDYE